MKQKFDLKIFRQLIELISYLKKSTKRNLIIIFFVMFLNSMAEFITIGSIIPLLTLSVNPNKISEINFLNFIQQFSNIKEEYQFYFIAFLVLIVITLSGFIKVFVTKLVNYFTADLHQELGEKLYRNIIYQDYSFHNNTNSSKLISSQTQQLEGAIVCINLFLTICISLLAALGIMFSLMVINLKIVLSIVSLFMIFYLGASIYSNKFIHVYGKIIFKSRINIIKILQESLGFIRQVILDTSHELFLDEYKINNKNLARSNAKLSLRQKIPRYLLEVIVLSLIVFIVIFMYANEIDFSSNIAIFGAFLLGIQRLLPLCQSTYTQYYQIIAEKFNLYAVNSLLKKTEKSEIFTREKSKNNLYLKNNIRFENLSFSYKENKVLEKINFEIRRGDVIGIVGKTGAGKSTFIDLLLGLIEPSEGSIFIDQKKMNSSLFRKFRLSVSSVPQDFFLLDRSIEDNIVFGNYKKNINNKYLNNILELTLLKDFIDSLNNGLKTYVGEDGVKLSGGQKQRIAIARALYKKHSILILDEATSAVDSETESMILNNIIRNDPKKTIIMIAHRLQTLKNCDYILEIKNKKLIKHLNLKEYQSRIKFN